MMSGAMEVDPTLARNNILSSMGAGAMRGAAVGGVYGGTMNNDNNHIGGAFSGAMKGAIVGGAGIGLGLGGGRMIMAKRGSLAGLSQSIRENSATRAEDEFRAYRQSRGI